MTKKTRPKIIILLSRFHLCVQSMTVSGFDSFIANNLGNFSNDSLRKPKRCSMTFCFATHALSYKFLYL